MAKHYSKSFKQQAVEAYFKSNLYIKAFSKQHNIPAGTIRGWVRQDSRYSSHTPKQEDTFVPIEVTPPELKDTPNIKINYPNGVQIEIPTGTSIQMVSSLINAY